MFEAQLEKTSVFKKIIDAIRNSVVKKIAKMRGLSKSNATRKRFGAAMENLMLCKKLCEKAPKKLTKAELIRLLRFVQLYGDAKIRGNQTAALLAGQSLTPKLTMKALNEWYIEIIKIVFDNCFNNALSTEKYDWNKHASPEEDANKCYYTQLPSLIFGLCEDTVELTKQFNVEMIPRVIDVAVDGFLAFATRYKDAAMAYKVKHFENREHFQKFTATMIAVINNLDTCCEFTDKLQKTIRITMENTKTSYGINRGELIQKIDQLKKKWKFAMQSVVSGLLDDIKKDIQPYLYNLMTRQWLWLTSSCDLDTICITIAHYFEDYCHIRPHLRVTLIEELMYKVVGEYIIAIKNRRLTYLNYNERHLAAERLKEESGKVEELFAKFLNRQGTPMITSVLVAMADILNLRDKSLLQLETDAFVRKFPDVNVELLASLMQAREDMNAKEAKAIAEDAVDSVKHYPKGDREMVKLFGV